METSVASTWAPSDVYHCGLDNCFGGVKPGTQHYEGLWQGLFWQCRPVSSTLDLADLGKKLLTEPRGCWRVHSLTVLPESEFQKPWEERQLYSE